ncbi:MAG: DNA polymerase I [Anaerovoracaceae bacterium]|nr:DNA polymerase I [Anaerovoracaceae bacterium]
MERIIIIDGNSLINRAFYAIQRPMITKEGIYTQGIYGFLSMLYKIEEDYSPDYAAVAFDLKEPTFRHKEYSGYKAKRRPMPPELAMEMPILKDILRAMNIAILEKPGFEADDILGTVSKIAEEKGIEPIIITGDKDSLQLASDTTKVLFTKKGVSDFDLYDKDKVVERYGLTPLQFIDLKGIMGDTSDNIPGVPGIGEKGGIELLTQFGSLENMLDHTDEIKKPAMRAKVEENADLARMSKHLATIIRDVPMDVDLSEMRFGEPDQDKLRELFEKLEFKNFLKKLGPAGTGKIEIKIPEDIREVFVRSSDDLDVLDAFKGQEVFVMQFGEFSHSKDLRPEGLVFKTPDLACYVDLRSLSFQQFSEKLNDLGLRVYGHDVKNFLYGTIYTGSACPEVTFDTSVCEYCIDPTRKDYGLESVAYDRLGYEASSDENAQGQDDQMDLFRDSAKDDLRRGMFCASITDALRKVQESELKKQGLEKVFYGCELPLIEVLASMEAAGICCDAQFLKDFGKSLEKDVQALENEIHDLAGETFNIKSPIQLGEILFEKLELPFGKKTKRGYSTSAEVLEKLRDKHPIVDKVLEYRNLTKLASTYIDGMIPLIAPDGRIHCHFQQTVAQTGRISCTEPNLQNIPVRQELGRQIRKAFHAGDGKVLIGADYSQIELRILAHLSEDEALLSAFNNNEDIHRLTASRVLGIPYDQVTPNERAKAKAVNFGVIYGMSGFGLSEEIHTTRKEAEEYIREYFLKHPKVKEYLDSRIELARTKGYAETILGRKRLIREISSPNYMLRQFGERLAMNTPIQGSAADIIKLAMNKVYRELKDKYPGSRLILQIHDELIIEADTEDKEEIAALLRRSMEEAVELSVKLTVDLNTSDNWYDLK